MKMRNGVSSGILLMPECDINEEKSLACKDDFSEYRLMSNAQDIMNCADAQAGHQFSLKIGDI